MLVIEQQRQHLITLHQYLFCDVLMQQTYNKAFKWFLGWVSLSHFTAYIFSTE